jgi:beta-lactamase regulating signal transducer with metallopeptidase domain
MNTADTLNTFLAALDAHPLLERLFFASAELAVLAALVALAIAGLRIRSPRACAMLWLIVLAKPVVTLAFGAVVPVLRLAPPDPIVAATPLPEAPPLRSEAVPQVPALELPPAPLPATPVKPSTIAIPMRPPINWSALAPRILASLWLTGVVLLLGSTLLDRIRLRRFLARTTSPSAHASAALAEGAASLQLRTAPPLRMTTELESPAVVGWFRSTIVIPQWLNAPENETALAWALRHELTHLKHRDPIANALRRLAQILFFFHPVTWWASQRWEAAVELACDRAVVRTDDDVTAYAEQLYAILVQARQQRQRTMATGLFATRTQINTRIAALLGNSLNTPARLGVAAAATLTLFAGTVFAVGGAIADREEAKEETAAEETEQPLPQPQDSALQATCESLLEGEAGAIVVLNADTGAVLAMASAPFGTMKEVIEGQKASGNASPIRPAYTRAYQEQYPPGSTFKILLAAAALEEGIITPETTHFCGGSYRINGAGRAWHCWKRDGHGKVNVTDALTYSCDVFFYNVGLLLGEKRICAWAARFGIGEVTGIDLPREMPGLIPDPEWKMRITKNNAAYFEEWSPGDTVNLTIGQGSFTVTPLQNAVMMATIVNGGYRVTPRMDPEALVGRGKRMLSDTTLEALHAALRKTVEKAPPDYPAGTGWRAGIDGIEILGKTGSAQIMSAAQQSKYASDEEIPYEMRDHAWFVAGVTDREPKISVSVLLEHGMHGGTGAAEIARAVIAEAYGIETSVQEITVVVDGETVILFKAEDAGQESATTRSRRSSLEKSTGPAVKERPYMVHLLSGQRNPADTVAEDESFYLLTYDSYTFKIRKALVREVVKFHANSMSELPQENPADVKANR